MNDSFYRAFEDRYRGSRDLIKSRLRVYMPFIIPLLDNKNDTTPQAVDLGCGRGEWLELLTEHGFIVQGVDLDEGMLEVCNELHLPAKKVDALDFLYAQEDNSIAVISGFHIAEHIAFNKLKVLVEQALRVLKPSGLLILETPNPENIVVGTANFYLDPTHQQPLPLQLLSFIAEYAGYERVKVLRLQEPVDLLASVNLTLLDVLSGVSPDYSIVAQKGAQKNTLKNFDSAFLKEHGVSLNEITKLYDGQMNNKTDAINMVLHTQHQLAEQLTSELSKVREEKAGTEASKEQLASELSKVREEKAATEALKQQLEENIQLNEKKLEKLIEEKAVLKSQLETELQSTVEHSTELAVQKEQQNQLITHIHSLQNELDITKDKVDELGHSSHHYWTVADSLRSELDSVYKSKSWLITWPLRKLMYIAKWLILQPVLLISWLTHLPKHIAKRLLILVTRIFISNPYLKMKVLNFLNKYPRFKQSLRNLTIRNGLIAGEIINEANASLQITSFNDLTSVKVMHAMSIIYEDKKNTESIIFLKVDQDD